jgi:hypothetical protein
MYFHVGLLTFLLNIRLRAIVTVIMLGVMIGLQGIIIDLYVQYLNNSIRHFHFSLIP